MKNITIGFSRSSGKFPIFSWLILLAQNNNFSHAYMRYHDDFTERDVVFQASGLQVNFVGFEFFKTKEIIVKEFEIEISDEAFKNIMQYAIDKAGQPYSMLQILNTAVYLLSGKSPWDNQIVGWDCSKLMADMLEKELGYQIPDDVDVITPKMLCDFLESKYGKAQ